MQHTKSAQVAMYPLYVAHHSRLENIKPWLDAHEVESNLWHGESSCSEKGGCVGTPKVAVLEEQGLSDRGNLMNLPLLCGIHNPGCQVAIWSGCTVAWDVTTLLASSLVCMHQR